MGSCWVPKIHLLNLKSKVPSMWKYLNIESKWYEPFLLLKARKNIDDIFGEFYLFRNTMCIILIKTSSDRSFKLESGSSKHPANSLKNESDKIAGHYRRKFRQSCLFPSTALPRSFWQYFQSFQPDFIGIGDKIDCWCNKINKSWNYPASK